MKRRMWLVGFLVAVGYGMPGFGFDWHRGTLRIGHALTVVPCDACVAQTDGCNACGLPDGWCAADDYCPKPWPCFQLPATCGFCDDYCPKPYPRLCVPATRGGCDDYCPKPAPDLCSPYQRTKCGKRPPRIPCDCEAPH